MSAPDNAGVSPLPSVLPSNLPNRALFDAKDRQYLQGVCGYLSFADARLCSTEYLKAAEDYYTGADAKTIAADVPQLASACETKTHATPDSCGRQIGASLRGALGPQ